MIREEELVVEELERGLRFVYLRRREARAGILGVAVRAGSVNDGPGRHGLAHFVEHTIFKGTQKRSSRHIINRMEAVGGELNAYTTKEETVVYTIFPSGEATRGADLVADLIVNSRFPEAELAKERDVVADEIDSYLDAPSEAVYDDFEDLLFAGSPLGHNILGTRAELEGFTSEICRQYLRSNYVRRNLVVFYCGSRPLGAIRSIVERCFASLEDGPVPESPLSGAITPSPRFDSTRTIGSHQAHTIGGCAVDGMFSPERHAIALLTNILGGPGMNSLLNIELRERRGLVYSVEASTVFFSNVGELCIYFGCDPDDQPECRRLCMEVIDRLASEPLSDRALAAAKKQYIGQMLIAGENRENRVLGAARQVLFRGRHIPADETREAIRRITAADLSRHARYLADNISWLTMS